MTTRRGGGEEAEVEEVTAEEFAGSRAWSAAFRGSFGPNLYNYAWAQAVQNKPLIPAAKPQDGSDEVEVEVEAEDEDGEKEEGEIEEGEIDEIMTVIVPDEPETIAESPELASVAAEEKDEIGEFDRRVSLILEDLETVTEEEARMSLEAVCARLRKSFENLKWMHTESQVPIIDALVQQAVMGMHTVHAVVVSSKLKKNEDLLLRLLIHIKNQYSVLLASEQLKENNQNDVGMIRMKPRDPRRILHNNTVPKSESLKPEPAKITRNLSSDTLSSKDRATVREQGEQAQTSGLPSQPPPEPDIARQFTTNLKSVANMISGTKAANISSTVSQFASQPIPGKMDKVDVMAAADLSGQKSVSGLASEGGIAGALQEPSPWGDVDHLLDGCDDQQKADIQRERVRRIEEQNTMFAARKLCLVLDLDHTLLNSAKFTEVDPIHDELLRKKEELDRENQYRHLFRFPHMGMWTKLRPGVWNFLERASKLFELHLYTMGNKLYATEMAKVLDPTGALFAGRVISRGDDNDLPDADERVPKTKDLDGVLGLESAVVIIDDSVRVWPHNKLNLIVVERYTYFPCSRRQFGLPGPSLLEIDHDERPEAGTLASSLAVIERIHSSFFSNRLLHEVDVRNILAAEQRKILAGCKVVFSRIFPVGEMNPQTHPLWQTAEQFGAVCTNQIDEHVTHVVANSLGTDKVNWALCTGRFVVQPGWVEASALLYRRANEHDFSVKI